MRIGNWVEEQFSREATNNPYDMEKFLKEQEDAQVELAKANQFVRNERIERMHAWRWRRRTSSSRTTA